MITATYFGEITELGSRAVWYSDEEDDDDEEGEVGDEMNVGTPSKLKPAIRITSHDAIRPNICSYFKRLKPTHPNVKITSCIISLSSSPHYKNLRLIDPTATLIGTFAGLGKVILCPSSSGLQAITQIESSLWILFDKTHPLINGQEVGYFVESLREQLYGDLGVDPPSPTIIVSQQFSSGEHLEYLSNYASPLIKLPFIGRPLLPPVLIKNQFESAFFEQSTIALKPSFVVCLPDPKNFWFDRKKSWPTVANQIIEHKLSDDNLEKTLIFT